MLRVAADLIVLLHFVFIAFVVLGGLLALKWRRIALLHVPCVLWGVLIEFYGWICPLTPLEQHLREAAGDSAYSGGFISQYVTPLVYPEELTRGMQISFAIAVVVVNLCVYGLLLFNKSKREGRRT